MSSVWSSPSFDEPLTSRWRPPRPKNFILASQKRSVNDVKLRHAGTSVPSPVSSRHCSSVHSSTGRESAGVPVSSRQRAAPRRIGVSSVVRRLSFDLR